MNYFDLILPSSWIAGSLIAGIVFQKIVLARLKRLTERTTWEGDDLIIKAVRGVAIFWFLLFGIYQASKFVSLPANQQAIVYNSFIAILILSITYVSARLVKGFITLSFYSTDGEVKGTSILSNLSKIVIYIIGILVILHHLGISIAPMLTALGVGGLAVALALQDTLSNLFAGIQILMSRQMKPGDFIRLDNGNEGFIIDISLRTTTIRQGNNNVIIIPNSKLSNAIVTNFNLYNSEMTVPIPVTVEFGTDLDRVEKIIKEVANQIQIGIEGGVPEFEPVVRFQGFGDFGIQLNAVIRSRDVSNQYLLRHEFVKALNKRFDSEKIKIPYPTRTVLLSKE